MSDNEEDEQLAIEKAVRGIASHDLHDRGFDMRQQREMPAKEIADESHEVLADAEDYEREKEEYLDALEAVAEIAANWAADPDDVAGDARRIVTDAHNRRGIYPEEW